MPWDAVHINRSHTITSTPKYKILRHRKGRFLSLRCSLTLSPPRSRMGHGMGQRKSTPREKFPNMQKTAPKSADFGAVWHAVSASAVRFLCAWNQMGGTLKTNYAAVIFSCACRWPIWALTRTMTIDFPEKIARYPCQAHLFANVLLIPNVFFGEFWLTSAVSRQNSSEQNGRSTYCAASLAPTRSVGCRWGQILRYKRKREKLSPPFTFCLSQSL